jgi:hypothetical protein
LKISLLNKLIFILFCSFTFIIAAKGPQYNALRVRGMGGAFVAVADDKDALYYNPAGLNLINRFGNFEKNPDMGYLPKRSFDFKLFGATIMTPAQEIKDVQNVCGTSRKLTVSNAIKKALVFDIGYFNLLDIEWCPVFVEVMPGNIGDITDSLNAHPELLDSLARFDRYPIKIGTQVNVMEFAMHNFGMSMWLSTIASPYVDVGVIIPYFAYNSVQIDAALQTAFAFSPVDKWSVGIGLKAAKRIREPGFEFYPLTYKEYLDTLKNRWENFAEDKLFSFEYENINFGLDFGALYQLTREVRLGSSLRNVFFSRLAGESITPNLSIGAAYSPMILQSNDWLGRKVNFAMDYADILDGTVGSMFFSHLNFGAEIEQVAAPSPTRNMPILSRALFGSLGGIVGGTIGYFIGRNFLQEDVGPFFMGSLLGIGTGTMFGTHFGAGGDFLRGSLGCGFEGGYWAFTGALNISMVELRFTSYGEEMGSRTGESEQRIWAGEFNVEF